MTSTAIIVQARMTSTRLPGKVLMDLAGRPVLAHVLARCAVVPGVTTVCCAIPEGESHDAVAVAAADAGAKVFRGSEYDVLDRYHKAALWLGAGVVLRVTSDCPLIDPVLCGRVLAEVTDGGADYACNNMPPSWPHGLDCEAFTMEALTVAAKEATAPAEREHVTPWLRANRTLRKANVVGPGGAVADHRWTLDFPEDLTFFRALFAALPKTSVIPSTDEVLAVLRRHPEIAGLNAVHHNMSRPTMPSSTKEPQ